MGGSISGLSGDTFDWHDGDRDDLMGTTAIEMMRLRETESVAHELHISFFLRGPPF